MSKKQLKRLREESISMDLAVPEEAGTAPHVNGVNGLLENGCKKETKKNKKKQREQTEGSRQQVIEEKFEGEEKGGSEDEQTKRDLLSEIQLDQKAMKGVPRNENMDDVDEDDLENEARRERGFNWHKAIKSALKAEDDLSLPVKKLRKKVLSEFMNHGGDCKIKNENEIWALFDKKLHSYPKAKIAKDRVTLVK